MRRVVSWVFLAVAPLALVVGCGPKVSNAELGRCQWEIPVVPGAEEPYVLTEFGKSLVPDPYEEELKKRNEATPVPSAEPEKPAVSPKALPSPAKPGEAPSTPAATSPKPTK